VLSHIPLGGSVRVSDIEIEQDLSRPYAYVSKRYDLSGFDLIGLRDPSRASLMYRWRIENPELHRGVGGRDGKMVKIQGRYYYLQSVQFDPGGPNVDLGAIIFDVTALPDTGRIREVARINAPDTPGGFHNIFAYKHSDGRALVFATVNAPHAKVYDVAQAVAGQTDPVVRIPLPETPAAGRGSYHDFYLGYEPSTRQDRFYGAGSGGYFVFDLTRLHAPRLLTSVTGVAGVTSGHTFTPDPTGRYAVTETEYQFAPLRLFDLKPGLDGEVKSISRPIGAWTADWRNLVHNHEVRWPYVFVSGYEDGLQVFNMMDPTNPYTVGYYDTFDGPHQKGLCGDRVCDGAFGIDVRNADGLIVISDMTTGFWAFRMDGFDGWNGHQWGMPNISSAQDWDNGPDGASKPAGVSLR
jgi:hypothetical protein